MPDENYNLYEYAVLRYLPSVEREEFVNVGLIMMCKRRRWLCLRATEDIRRLSILGGGVPLEALQRQIRAFADIAAGAPTAGPVAAYPVEERFRWLTAEKSACLRTSAVHPGLSRDLSATFNDLYQTLVE